MTGGAGFTKQGQVSQRNNRALLKNRRSLRGSTSLITKDSPDDKRGDLDYKALKDWQKKQSAREMQERLFAFIIFTVLGLFFLIYFVFFG